MPAKQRPTPRRRGANLLWGVSFVLVILAADAALADVNRRAIIGSAVADWQDPKYAAVDDAIAAFEQQQFDAALAQLNELAKSQPQLPSANTLLAQMYFGVGDVASGRAALEAASAANPAEPEPYVMLGELDLQEGRHTSAAALFEKSLDFIAAAKWKNDFRQRNLRINTLAGLTAAAISRSDWRLARSSVDAWLKLEPESARAHSKLGEIHFRTGDAASAYAAFQTSSKLTSGGLPAEVAMALLYEQQAMAGDEAKRNNAQRAMEKAIELAPENFDVRLLAGAWAFEAGRLPFADEQAVAALKLNADSTEALFLAGKVDRSLGRHEQAVKRFRAIVAAAPTDALAMKQLSLALLQVEGGTKLALEFARLLHATQPSRDSSVVLAWAALHSNNAAEAMNLLQQDFAGELSEESTAIAGRLLLQLGQREQAVLLLRQAVASPRYFPGQEAVSELLK